MCASVGLVDRWHIPKFPKATPKSKSLSPQTEVTTVPQAKKAYFETYSTVPNGRARPAWDEISGHTVTYSGDLAHLCPPCRWDNRPGSHACRDAQHAHRVDQRQYCIRRRALRQWQRPDHAAP